ncbi:MAG TPA: D-alanyl-D-alanine carboxypeptidase/D-alanyl-D-alanine-endopeptidase [Methylophilus sp.]
MKLLLCFLSLLAFSLAAHAELPASVVAALAQAGIPQSNVSIYVQPVDSATPTISHNATKAMNPASLMKLVTTFAALDILTPAYRWKTEVYRDGEVKQGELYGNLILKGYGDPSFDAARFWRLLMALQQAGITQVKGDFIIDKTHFAEQTQAKQPFDDEIWRAYNAMPSAFLVNGRHTSFKFAAENGAVTINQEFELPQIKIINRMQVKAGACDNWRQDLRYVVKPLGENVQVTFDGTLPSACDVRYMELSVLDDTHYAFYSFKKLWAQLGGTFNGRLVVKAKPENATLVMTHQSSALGDVIRDINKWSNNLMARQLLLTLAAEKNGIPAIEAEGATVIKQSLMQHGLTIDNLVMDNGSGLSRSGRVTAQQLGQILVMAYASPVMPEFMSSLSIIGLDGTAKNRLSSSSMQGRAHLKTGSLDGVSSIAGYLINKKNQRLIMVMMVNDAKAYLSRTAQDALMRAIAE